jgi:hypothetical protein
MFINSQIVLGSAVEGADGPIGSVQDLLFEGQTWNGRYLIVEAGRWLENRELLLSVDLIEDRDWVARELAVPLIKDRVRNSPPFDPQEPVSRQQEIELADYYTVGDYWNRNPTPGSAGEKEAPLQSCRSLVGFGVEGYDGPIGNVKEMVVDDRPVEGRGWEIRYLVVDARDWMPGRLFLLPPHWSDSVAWDGRQIHMEMVRETIGQSPRYDPAGAISRAYEEQLFDYYRMPKYWAGHPV